MVRRVLVKNRGDADYTLRYQINLATLNATLGGNTRQLDDLNAFVGRLMADTLLRVASADITGYSSPDGPEAFNKALATRRARDFKAYVDKKYDFSKKYAVTVHSVAEDWAMCRTSVAAAPVPEKQAVLAILDGKQSPAAKEAALKKMPEAWNYLIKNILPPLRRVELTIDYGAGRVVAVRTLIPRPVPTPAPAPAPAPAAAKQPVCAPCDDEVVDESTTGIIVAMPEDESRYRRQTRQDRREVRQEVTQVRTAVDHDAREARRIGRQEMKAANKIARKEAKAAKKAEKAARKTYKDLEKM